MGFLKKIFRRTFFTILLVSAAYGAWRWGPSLLPRIQEWTRMTPATVAEESGPSSELADSVLVLVQDFRQGGGGQMALGGAEVTSVLRYSLPGLIPSGVQELVVDFHEGRAHLSARVVLGSFPDLPDLGPVLGILPDTLDVVVHAALMPFGEEESALLVQGLEAARIPIPRRFIPQILSAIGRTDRPGLPPEALAVPLPAGLRSAYILTDSLIISSAP